MAQPDSHDVVVDALVSQRVDDVEQPDVDEREQLLAEAIRVLTAAARLTRPVLELDEQASATSGSPTYRDSGRTEPDDFAEFVTQALAGAAANAGGVETVLAGRPGSWEADGVRQLLLSTVGHDSEFLWEHRTQPLVVQLYVDELMWDNPEGLGLAYQNAASELSQRPIAAPAGTDEYEDLVDELAGLEDLLEDLRMADWSAYGDALAAAVRAAAARRPGLTVPVVVEVDLETLRSLEDTARHWGGALVDQLLDEAIAATPLPGDGRPPLERLQAAGVAGAKP